MYIFVYLFIFLKYTFSFITVSYTATLRLEIWDEMGDVNDVLMIFPDINLSALFK